MEHTGFGEKGRISGAPPTRRRAGLRPGKWSQMGKTPAHAGYCTRSAAVVLLVTLDNRILSPGRRGQHREKRVPKQAGP